MPRNTSDLAKEIISNYYDREGEVAADEAMTVRFTAQLPYDDLAMVDAIAHRFSDTRANLVNDILREFVIELFLSLSEEDKKTCSQLAAENEKRHEEKNNFTSSGKSKWLHMIDSQGV